MRFSLSDIRKKYRLSASCEDNAPLTICDLEEVDKVYGGISADKSKIYFHGFPDAEPRRVTSMEELELHIKNHLEECEQRWVDPRAITSMYNREMRVCSALHYVARRLGWKKSDKWGSSDSFYVGSEHLGCDMLTIGIHRTDFNGASFHIGYRNGCFTDSPYFSDYMSALEWLQSILVPLMLLVGSDEICQANAMASDKSNIGQTTISKLNLSKPGFVEVKSLKEVMIGLLEDQLRKIKNEE